MIFNIRQVRTGRLYIQTLIALAAESVRLGRPRFKVRPKVHVLQCEILLRIESGARFNPRYASCFVEEDRAGQITAIAKASVHASTVSKRYLERWLLQYNSFLAGEGKQLEFFALRVSEVSSVLAFSSLIPS